MKILLLYLTEKYISNMSFDNIKYDKIIIINNKKSFKIQYNLNGNAQCVIFDNTFFDFSIISETIKKYDYVLYLDDSYTYDYFDINNLVNTSLNIIDNKKFDQVIFGLPNDEAITEKKNINDVEFSIPVGNHLFFQISENKWRRHEMISQIFVDKTNKYEPSNINVDHIQYVKKNFSRITNFKLAPSLIKSSFVNFIDNEKHIELKKCPHFEYVYSLELEKNNFKTCYLNNKKIITFESTLDDMEDVTIVTGFLDLNINRQPKRSTQVYSYIEKSYPTLSIKQNMIAYVSEETINHVVETRTKLNLMDKTKVILISKENLFMLNRLDDVKNAIKNNIAPYDNDYLLLLVNSRYNYILDAIEKNYFNTNYFCWIDFSAGHVVKIPENLKLRYNKKDTIKIAWIGRFNNNSFNLNHRALGGGIFMGHKEIMKEFIRLHNKEFEELLDDGYCVNDDKLLFLLFEKYPYLFDTFFSGYEFMMTKM